MSYYKIIVAISFLALSFVVPGRYATAEARILKTGVFIVDPLIKKVADGKYAGSVIEVLEDIASKEDWTLQYVECKFPVCLEKLEAGEIDLMGSITLTEDRIDRIDFTHETFFMDWGQIYSAPNTELNNILDLDNKRIAVLRNTAQYPPFAQLLKSFGINAEILFVDDYLDVFRFVDEGKADALMINRLFGEKHFKDFHIHRTSIIFTPMDIRYATPKGRQADVREAIDRNLAALKEDKDSIYYSAISNMFSTERGLANFPGWAKWTLYASAAASLLLFLNSIYLKKQVRVRTASLEKESSNREHISKALEHSERFLQSIIDNEPECVKLLNADGELVSINKSGLDMIQAESLDQVKGKQVYPLIAPEFRDGFRELTESVCKGTPGSMAFKIVGQKGRELWLESKAVPFFDEQENRTLLLGVTRDITDRVRYEKELKRSLSEKEVLLREVHHRVKNNMQIISSLANLQSRFVKDEADRKIFEESQNRIRSMALVHEKLYQSDDLQSIDIDSYLRSITYHLMHSSGADKKSITIEHDIEAVTLPMDKLIPCGLIVTELVSNSIEHAFHEKQGGNIAVTLRRTDKGGFCLTVGDDGDGLPEGFNPDSLETLGLMLVNSLVRQLDAKASFSSDAGTTVIIEFAGQPEATVV